MTNRFMRRDLICYCNANKQIIICMCVCSQFPFDANVKVNCIFM